MEKSRAQIAGIAKRGFLFLTGRTIITNILQLISSLALAKLLRPVDYSIFGILNGLINSLSFFTDIGLHEVLVQQKEKIQKLQLQTYLTFRLIVSVVMSMIFAISFYFLKDYYQISESSLLIYFLGLFTILEVMSTIPTIYFQKELEFAKLANIELVATVLLYLGQISFAYLGFNFWCFFFGIFIRYLVMIFFGFRSGLYYWPSYKSLYGIKKYFNKGLYFQFNLMLTATHAILIPIILKFFLDLEVIGLLFWITGLVSIPNSFIYNFNQTLFPAIAKVQLNINDVRILITKASELILFLIIFIFGLGATIGPAIVYVVFDEKWHDAKDLLPLVSLGIGLFNIKNIGNTLLAGIGKPNKRTQVEVFNLFILVISTIFFSSKYGVKGYLMAIVLSNFLSLAYLSYQTKEYLGPKILKRFIVLSISSLCSYFCVRYFQLDASLINSFVGFVFVFFIICLILDRNILIELIIQIKKLRGRVQMGVTDL